VRLRLITSAACLFLSAGIVHADVKLPAIFGSHMVLQRDQKVPVWGTADAGEEVTITLGDAKATATTGADGKWSATLDSLKTSEKPSTMTVAGKNTVTFEDVLVGDVWVASGQSNMEFQLSRANTAGADIAKADLPEIRLFLLQRKVSWQPLSDCTGTWQVCSPKTAPGFSAVGFYFAREINKTQGVPVGMIGTYWGGTPAQAWTSIDALAGVPELGQLADAFAKQQKNMPASKEKYEKETLPTWQAAHDKWAKEVGDVYNEAMKKFQADAAAAKAENKPLPPKPVLAAPEPKKPGAPDQSPNVPSVLYNGMIAPIVPFAIKGAIWYQGEANAGQPAQYRTLFPTMITDWRTRWGQGDFPFVWVQLTNFHARLDEPTQTAGGWPGLREAQAMTLKLPNTGQAVIIDIGNPNDIHPTDKLDVGHRVALSARHIAYGEQIVYSGPTLDSMKIEDGKVRIKFKNVGGGLAIAAAPSTQPSVPQAEPASELKGFAIAGDDKKFVWATATIDGDSVIVSSPAVKTPVAVRYAWADNPECNLYNKEMLPASPFRTDDWVDPPKATTKP